MSLSQASDISRLSGQDAAYTRLVDHYSRYIDSPVSRLKFLNSALGAECDKRSGALKWMRWLSGFESLESRARLTVELSKFLPAGRRLPVSFRVLSTVYRFRFAAYGACLGLALAGGTGAVFFGAKLAGGFSVSTEAKAIATTDDMKRGSKTAGPSDSAQFNALETMGSNAGLPLDRVWLAESGQGYEFYSNGARILTEFETSGPERKFYRFPASGAEAKEEPFLMSKPAGIVFHISESDLLPFAGQYNSSLKVASRSLLDYARAHRLYNYVIDRFGRIYRIVRDEHAANHAGNSVWGDQAGVYVNLNAGFLGVCFEGRSAPGAVGPDGINEAQIYGARVLTAVLRSKFGIDDADCVTHGLVSVNPSKRLLGYHTDWVSGFPFEAIGLRDKYQAELAAIASFGFGYDRSYLAAAGGKRWPGLDLADQRLAQTALARGISIEQERAELWKVFETAYARERDLDLNR
jgi:hypothetical protein